MLELIRTMVLSIGVASYVQDVGRLTDEVARATSSGYVRGSRAASFSTCWIDRVSRCVLRLGLVRTNGSVLVLVMILV